MPRGAKARHPRMHGPSVRAYLAKFETNVPGFGGQNPMRFIHGKRCEAQHNQRITTWAKGEAHPPWDYVDWFLTEFSLSFQLLLDWAAEEGIEIWHDPAPNWETAA